VPCIKTFILDLTQFASLTGDIVDLLPASVVSVIIRIDPHMPDNLIRAALDPFFNRLEETRSPIKAIHCTCVTAGQIQVKFTWNTRDYPALAGVLASYALRLRVRGISVLDGNRKSVDYKLRQSPQAYIYYHYS
jgi:hypothetical protein